MHLMFPAFVMTVTIALSLSLWLRLRWLYCSSNQSPAADRRSKVRSQSRARWADLQSLHRPRRAWSTSNIFYNWHQIFLVIDTKSDFSYVYRNWLSRRTTFSKLWWSGNKTSVSELFRLMMNDQVEWNEMNTAISNHASKTEGVKWSRWDRDVLPHAGGLPADQNGVQSVPLHRAHAHRGGDSLQYQVSTRTPGLRAQQLNIAKHLFG